MLVLNLQAFENKKYTANEHFQGNGPYGETLTKKEPIKTLGFTLPYSIKTNDTVFTSFPSSVLKRILRIHLQTANLKHLLIIYRSLHVVAFLFS